jgi:hypothetical protein
MSNVNVIAPTDASAARNLAGRIARAAKLRPGAWAALVIVCLLAALALVLSGAAAETSQAATPSNQQTATKQAPKNATTKKKPAKKAAVKKGAGTRNPTKLPPIQPATDFEDEAVDPCRQSPEAKGRPECAEWIDYDVVVTYKGNDTVKKFEGPLLAYDKVEAKTWEAKSTAPVRVYRPLHDGVDHAIIFYVQGKYDASDVVTTRAYPPLCPQGPVASATTATVVKGMVRLRAALTISRSDKKTLSVIDGGWSGRRSTHREGTGFDTTGRLGPSLCSLFRVFSQSSIEYGGSGFRLDEKDVQLRVSPPIRQVR